MGESPGPAGSVFLPSRQGRPKAMAPFGQHKHGSMFQEKRMARKKNTGIYIAALLLFLGGVGYLAYSGFSENSVYFLNVSEAKAATPDKLVAARLFGTVAEEGIEKHRGAPGVSFRLEDKDNASQTIEVNYSGAVPDTFNNNFGPGLEGIQSSLSVTKMERISKSASPSRFQNGTN